MAAEQLLGLGSRKFNGKKTVDVKLVVVSQLLTRICRLTHLLSLNKEEDVCNISRWYRSWRRSSGQGHAGSCNT